MPEPVEDQFACIGCGAMNPVGAEACAGCGHRFAGPEGQPPSTAGPSPTPGPPPRPLPEKSFPIRPILLVVVLVGVGVGIFFASTPLGIAYCVAAVAGLVGTLVDSRRRARDGRPIGADEKVRVFAGRLGQAFLVLISSAIAFVATCFPIGLIGMSGEVGGNETMVRVAFVVGGLSALLVGGGVAYYLIKKSRPRDPKK